MPPRLATQSPNPRLRTSIAHMSYIPRYWNDGGNPMPYSKISLNIKMMLSKVCISSLPRHHHHLALRMAPRTRHPAAQQGWTKHTIFIRSAPLLEAAACMLYIRSSLLVKATARCYVSHTDVTSASSSAECSPSAWPSCNADVFARQR